MLRFSLNKSKSWFAVATKIKQKTHYQVLQLPSNAPPSIIKKNYYRLAKIYHPDVYKGKDQSRFEKIQEAYKILSNQTKRRGYDNEIGVNKQQNQSESTSQNTNSNPKQDLGKPQNPMDYDIKTEQINIDDQYEKFFGQKTKTHFEEIRMHQARQFRSMSEAERVRRHFTQTYQSDETNLKTRYQEEYDTILNDQIDQRNKLHDDNIKTIKRMETENRPQNLKKNTKWLTLFFIIFSLGSLPVINSILTKYQLEKKQRQLVQKLWKQAENQAQQIEIRNRFQY